MTEVLRIMDWPSFILGVFTGVMVMVLPLFVVVNKLAFELGMKSEERKLADLRARQEEEDETA